MRLPEGVSNVGQSFFTTDLSPDISEGRSALFDVVGTGEFMDDELDMPTEPAWMGTITGRSSGAWLRAELQAGRTGDPRLRGWIH